MKARITLDRESWKGVFDKGDIVEIRVIPYEKDTVIANEGKRPETQPDGKVKMIVWCSEVVAPKGSYKDMEVKSKNGEWYSSQWFINSIGYKPITEYMEKIEESK